MNLQIEEEFDIDPESLVEKIQEEIDREYWEMRRQDAGAEYEQYK